MVGWWKSNLEEEEVQVVSEEEYDKAAKRSKPQIRRTIANELTIHPLCSKAALLRLETRRSVYFP